jgi:diguanylate cyclase (GGDEF)-like protein
VGALCAIDVAPRTFDAAQIELLSSFAALVVDELELRMIAQTDFLTGATSRRGFTVDVERALALHAQAGVPATLVALDLDRFKSINDTLGHSAGDQVLTSLVKAMGGLARAQDVVGRIGGEEFAVLLPGTEIEEAMAVAERLRGAVAGMKTPGHPDLQVTASFGVASATAADSVAGWMARADRALYTAKDSGRNRCCQG